MSMMLLPTGDQSGCQEEDEPPKIVFDSSQIEEEPENITITYKKKKKDVVVAQTTTNISSITGTDNTSTLTVEDTKFSPRGITKPGIKTALPPTEVESSLRTSTESTILSPGELLVLVGWMPRSQRLYEFELSYLLRRDGACLDTLYSLCSDSAVSSSFIVVEDADGHVFGGFLTQSFKKSTKFYGSGESFVFSIRPELEVFRWQGDVSSTSLGNDNSNSSGGGRGVGGSGGDGVVGMSDKNDCALGMCVLSDSEKLIMGGGEGFAFFLNDDLRTGQSQRSQTYNNKRLSKEEFFSCLNVEVWTTKPPREPVPVPPLPAAMRTPTVSFAATSLKETPILLTKKTRKKPPPTNPSSLSFACPQPVKKGRSNALNQWQEEVAVIIQSTWRGIVCFRAYARVKRCVVVVQRLWRGYRGRLVARRLVLGEGRSEKETVTAKHQQQIHKDEQEDEQQQPKEHQEQMEGQLQEQEQEQVEGRAGRDEGSSGDQQTGIHSLKPPLVLVADEPSVRVQVGSE
mmetsp:Transcript_19754/g.36776  ORF Transcript_19754/g.36776 Transcript_19754/m.36776 type:complete len:514 (-) Transcript_19754:203-1744(-)